MSWRLPRTTFGLVALASSGLCLVTLVLGGAVYVVSHEALEQQLDHRIEAESTMLVATAKSGGPATVAAAIRRREDGHRLSELGYLLVDRHGKRLAGELDAVVPEPGWQEFLAFNNAKVGDRGIAQALTTRLDGGERLVVAADRTVIDEIDSMILGLFAATFGVMLLIGIAGAWAMGSVIRGRLDRINVTAQAIIDGDLARRVERDHSSSEFDLLADTLNRMLDRNAELLENLRQVSSDIAHDLRTPLMRQTQVLDDALVGDCDANDYRHAIEIAAESGRELLELFAALLRISEIESFAVRAAFKPVDLAEVVERVADAFRPDSEAARHALSISVAAGSVVEGDRHLLSQMLANLIENAIRHTPAGSTITFELRREEGGVVLRVADDGPGIEPGDRDHVVRRFSRLERSRSTPGHGLGLSLVDAIARAHFATLSFADNRPGLVVNLVFPVAGSAPL